MKEISKEEIIQEALDKTKFEEEKIKENCNYSEPPLFKDEIRVA